MSLEPDVVTQDGHEALSIAELYDEVDAALGVRFPKNRGLWVRGEIQSVSDRTGHCYMDLVDPETTGGRQGPVLKVKCWRTTWGTVRTALSAEGIELEPGMVVMLRGTVDFYRPKAELGFILAELDVTALLGRLAARRAALLRALEAEGLLRANKSLTVGAVPLRVGLVASPGTEGYRDFTGQLEASGFAFEVLLAPVKVQGAAAPRSLARALRRFEGVECDVVVVVRGGGSRGDLGAFDSEPVARAIATLALPVWTGIGHTGDQSVADHVAHRAFETPTAAGHELVTTVADWWSQTVGDGAHVATCARRALDEAIARDGAARTLLARGARHHLEVQRARLSTSVGTLARCVRTVPDTQRSAVADRAARLVPLAQSALGRTEDQLAGFRRLLDAYDVERQLERGYTLSTDESGRILKSAAAVAPGMRIRTRFFDGSATSVVERAETPAEEDGT
jgi:exodeoxyribonuclease VII large subunit